jgi:hypothetical protein
MGGYSYSWRRKRAVEALASAADALGPVEPGMSVFGVSRGQFAMIDMIQHCLAQTGPAQVSLWTWVIADYEVDVVGGLLANGGITGATLLLDYSAGRRLPAIVDAWRDRFGESSVKIVRNHAKIARVWNDRFRLLLRGSMNLNYNPRFEQFDVTEGGPDFDLVAQLEAEIPVLPRRYDHQQVFEASGLGRAFDAATLGVFDGGKEWQP